MRSLSLVAFAGWCVGVVACGGQTTNGGAPPSVGGTIAGKPVAAATDSVGLVGVEVGPTGNVVTSYAGAVLTNLTGTCTILQQGGNPANATALSLSVSTIATPNGVPVGAYPIHLSPTSQGGTEVTAEYVVQDATCTATTEENAESGTITLTVVTAQLVAGTFDVTFPSGDHLSGSFSSPVCDAVPGQGQSQPVCRSY